MKNYLLIHLMPYEIDWFEWQAKQLKIGSHYINHNDNIIIDITLNLNLTDWEKSKIPKQFFIDKFNNIIKICFDWCEIITDINQDNTCLGVLDKRRNSIRKYKDAKNFIFLDCDLIFKPQTLKILIDASKLVTNEYYIISPQIPKLWDYSWDILVNHEHINDLWDNKTFIDPYSVISKNYGQLIIQEISTFKFGGGWFNLLSANLLRLIDIPNSFGSYGPDDTYIMMCCFLMQYYKKDVRQFVLNNMVISENHKYRINNYENYLISLNNRAAYREKSELNLNFEVDNFKNKLN
jgi:hypothetical protein